MRKSLGTEMAVAAIATMLGAVGASGAMYLTVVGRYVSKDEVRHLISVEAPYAKDQKWLLEKLEAIERRLGRTENKVDELLRRTP